MKWIKKCPLFLLLVISGILLAIAGISGQNSIYKEYSFNILTKPYLALAMEGLEKGVYPWEAPAYKQTAVHHTINSENQDDEAEEVIAKVMTEFDKGTGEKDGKAGQETGNLLRQNGAQGNGTDEDVLSAIANLNKRMKENSDWKIGGKTEELGSRTNEEYGGLEENAEGTAVEPETTYRFTTVTEDYFDDAVFIGDSRTAGMFEYGGIEERADFFAKISLTIYDVFTSPIAKDEETGKKITVEEALMKKQYGKVYLMLGINELGTGTTQSFLEEYRKVVERLRELQPDAIVFVEGIMRVTASKNEEDPIFNNTNINDKNSAIAKLADNKKVFYIDVNEVVCDESGNLNENYTADEVHLKAQYYAIWKQFLLEHGIVKVSEEAAE